VDAPLADRPLGQPHAKRLSPSHPHYARILSLHAEALERGDPGYRDPVSGLFVFSAAFHADRGYCCESGCRHCPYVV
jgi:hypothetical protein